ncbi:MAG TPA: arginyltransferase [Chthoniobacteraceae bacterium]|nr:arginyltransferase [Chthoniobacteraceae bacterium]
MEQIRSYWPTWPLPVRQEVAITSGHACGYLAGRQARFRAFQVERMAGSEYQKWMDAGFRRSGAVVYQPMCPGCRACRPLRVPVGRLAMSKSQRRVMRRNRDLQVRVGVPRPTTEKWELYDRYQREWHDGKQAGDVMAYVNFLYQSPVETVEFEYRDLGGKLLGIGICDLCETSVSSMYFYFEPREAKRSLGTFSALYEILWAKEMKIPYWYAGFWVNGCDKMEYKTRFRPCELLGTDGIWRETAEPNTPSPKGAGPAPVGGIRP